MDQPPQQQTPMTPPPSQPQWTPPPQQPMNWGGPGYGAQPPRPIGVTLGGIFLVVMGILWLLGGAACAVGGAAIVGLGSQVDNGSGFLGAAAGVVFVFAIIALVIGILQIAAGAGSLGGRGWARGTGIIVSIISALLAILGGCSAFTASNAANGGTTSGIGALVVGVLYALTAYALITAGPYFSYRR